MWELQFQKKIFKILGKNLIFTISFHFKFWYFQEIKIFFQFSVLSNILQFPTKNQNFDIFKKISKFPFFYNYEILNKFPLHTCIFSILWFPPNFHFSDFLNFPGYARIRNFTTLLISYCVPPTVWCINLYSIYQVSIGKLRRTRIL